MDEFRIKLDAGESRSGYVGELSKCKTGDQR